MPAIIIIIVIVYCYHYGSVNRQILPQGGCGATYCRR